MLHPAIKGQQVARRAIYKHIRANRKKEQAYVPDVERCVWCRIAAPHQDYDHHNAINYPHHFTFEPDARCSYCRIGASCTHTITDHLAEIQHSTINSVSSKQLCDGLLFATNDTEPAIEAMAER